MLYIIVIILIITLFILLTKYKRERNLKQLKIDLTDNWGKQKENEYFNLFYIKSYFQNKSYDNKKVFHVISDRTEIDLDLFDLFKFIDRTTSKIGQQYLYDKIRNINHLEELRKFESLTDLFINDSDLRLKCQVELSSLSNNNSYGLENLINDEPIIKPHYFKYIKLNAFLSLFSIFLSFINPLFILLLLPIFSINFIFHYKNKENLNYYVNSVNQLILAHKVTVKLESFHDYLNLFDLTFLDKIRKIKGRASLISFENTLNSEFTIFLWIFIELLKIQFNIESILFFKFIDSITKERKYINDLYKFIGEIDCAISTASLKSGNLNICKPHFTINKEIKIKAIYHPLIDNCVKNDLHIVSKSLLLTGSNMSGKTTFIRTISINSILSQTLNICFGDEFHMPFLKLHTSIRVSDDLLNNTSYFLEEVSVIKEMIIESYNSVPNLFVMDEVFKGTNTIERISASKSILSFLNKNENLVFVSTHDIELTDLLEPLNFELFHFTEKIENNQLLFDHKIKKGKLTNRNAIRILELLNFPKEVIKDAKKTIIETFANTI